MAPFIHGEHRALGCCKDIFEEPDPVSFLGPPWRLMSPGGIAHTQVGGT